jgi:hypothetical protein
MCIRMSQCAGSIAVVDAVSLRIHSFGLPAGTTAENLL